jgi:hypothetical protein
LVPLVGYSVTILFLGGAILAGWAQVVFGQYISRCETCVSSPIQDMTTWVGFPTPWIALGFWMSVAWQRYRISNFGVLVASIFLLAMTPKVVIVLEGILFVLGKSQH